MISLNWQLGGKRQINSPCVHYIMACIGNAMSDAYSGIGLSLPQSLEKALQIFTLGFAILH